MADYGGFGGIWGTRGLEPGNKFEEAVEHQLGDKIRSDDKLAIAMWSALANVDWKNTNGDTAGYSFRAAGDLVAAIRGSGVYMDWYCSGPDGVVSEEIAGALAKEGWTYEIL